jgi:hypothetical protein
LGSAAELPFMFKFNIGKVSNKTIITTGIVLSTLIAALSQCTGIHENNLWDILDEVQRKYFPQTTINRVIIQDPEKLNRRIQRDVNKVIDNVMPEYDRIISDYDKKYKQRYVEEKNNETVCYTDSCKSLAPPMRICAPWIDTCPKD